MTRIDVENCGKEITFSKAFVKQHTKELQKYSSDYCIIDNEGRGDCFFLAIQQAADLHSLPNERRQFTVERLRAEVATKFSKAAYSRIKNDENYDFLVNDENPDAFISKIKNDTFKNTKSYMLSSDYWADLYTIEYISKPKFYVNKVYKRLRFIIYDNMSKIFWIPTFFYLDMNNDFLYTIQDYQEYQIHGRPSSSAPITQIQLNDEWRNYQRKQFHYILLINQNPLHYGLVAKKSPQGLKAVFEYDDLPTRLQDEVNIKITNLENFIRPPLERRSRNPVTLQRTNVRNERPQRSRNPVRNERQKKVIPKVAPKKIAESRIPYENLNKKEKKMIDDFLNEFDTKDKARQKVYNNPEKILSKLKTLEKKKNNNR